MAGQKLTQVYSQEHGLSLVFQPCVLQISLQAGQPLIGLLPERPTHPTSPATSPQLAPSSFAMLLRKYLNGARLQNISWVAGDRILQGTFLRGGESCVLVLELTGRHANFFLLNTEQVLLGLWRKDRSILRNLHSGQLYQAPPLPPPHSGGLTPFESQLAALPADGSRSELLWQAWEAQGQSQAVLARLQQLAQRLKQAQKSLARKLSYWEQALQRAEAAPQLQRWGELLQGAWNQVPVSGAGAIRVLDYYDPEQSEVEIPLDPALNFQANLARYFRLAQRLQKTQVQAEAQLLGLWEKQSALERWTSQWSELQAAVLAALAKGANETAEVLLAQAEQAAEAAGLSPVLSTQRRQSSQSPKAKAAQPWREYQTGHGQIIRVGKGAQANEKLLKLARGHDLWLHTRNWPGAYVWVPLLKDQPLLPDTLQAAALLALHFSQMPDEHNAEIMFTPFKFLHKPRKAKSGEVSVRQFKTLTVTPDPAVLGPLLNSPPA